MKIGIASLSASPLYTLNAKKVLGEYSSDVMSSYDRYVSNIPRLFTVINKDTDGNVIHYCKVSIGLLQQFRQLMDDCVRSGTPMARRFDGCKFVTLESFLEMFCETSRTLQKMLDDYSATIRKRAAMSSYLNDALRDTAQMMLELDSKLDSKVLYDTLPLPKNLYG